MIQTVEFSLTDSIDCSSGEVHTISVGNLKWNKMVGMRKACAAKTCLFCWRLASLVSLFVFFLWLVWHAGRGIRLGVTDVCFPLLLSLLLFLSRAYNCWEKKWIYCHCWACCQVTRARCYLEKFNTKVLLKERDTWKHSKPSIKNSSVFWIIGFLVICLTNFCFSYC